MLTPIDESKHEPVPPDPLAPAARKTALCLAFAIFLVPLGYRFQWDMNRGMPLVLLTPALWVGRDLISRRFSRSFQAGNRLLLVAVVFVFATLLSILGTIHWAASLTTACTWVVLSLGAVLTAEVLQVYPTASRLLLGAMVISVAAATSLHWFRWKTGGTSFHAFYSHPRLMGLHALGGALASIAMLRQATRRGERLAWLFPGTLAWGGLLWSGSRSPLVGVAAGLLIWFLKARGRDRVNLALTTSTLVAGGMLISFAFWTDHGGLGWWHVAQRTAVAQSVQQITSNRSSFWTDAMQHALASPWYGYGPDAYGFLTPKLEGAQPHNLILQVTLDVGAPGAVAAAVLMLFCLWRGWRTENPDALTNGWLALAGGSVVAAQLDGYFYYPIASIISFLALGACATDGPSKISTASIAPPARFASASRWVVVASMALLLFHCALFHYAYHCAPPARPDAFVARVWRIFPSVTYNIDNWVDAWAKEFPDEALETSLFARPRSQSPEIFRVKTAFLLARRGAIAEAVEQLQQARAEVAPEYQPTIDQILRQIQTTSPRRSESVSPPPGH